MLDTRQPAAQRAGSHDAARLTEEVAAALADGCPEISAEVVAHLLREMPELRTGERDVSLLAASVEENVATLLHALEHDIDRGAIEAPAAAAAYGRRLAQRGTPVAALERAYRISHGDVLERCCAQLAEGDADRAVTACAAVRMTRATFAYADRVAAQVIEAYEAERGLWGNGRAAERSERVSALLAGEDVDVEATERLLGYRLRRRHLGVVAWVDEAGNGATELALLDRVVRRVAERAGAAGAPLFVPRDATSAWAWVPLARPPRRCPRADSSSRRRTSRHARTSSWATPRTTWTASGAPTGRPCAWRRSRWLPARHAGASPPLPRSVRWRS